MFSIVEEKKPIVNDTKTQQGELSNILRWYKNIYTRLREKHRSGWVVTKQHLSVKNPSKILHNVLKNP